MFDLVEHEDHNLTRNEIAELKVLQDSLSKVLKNPHLNATLECELVATLREVRWILKEFPKKEEDLKG